MVVKSVFEQYIPAAYPNMFLATLHVHNICGGIPSDPRVAEAWLRTKITDDNERLIQKAVSEVMTERGVTADEAVGEVNKNKHLNGFKRERCPNCPPTGPVCDKPDAHQLYIEGRQLKAGIKEAANVRWPYPHKWGRYTNSKSREVGGKSSPSFFAEHVFVQEDHLLLGFTEPTGVNQKFVHTFHGAGIQYEEYCDGVDIECTIASDWDFTDEQWALLWLTGGQQGLGASRSQGYGRYAVTRWDRIK